MNAQAQVLQALDAAQAALRRIEANAQEDAEEIARSALEQLINAPWSMVARASEADQHGWLIQIRESLRKIAEDPFGEDVERLAEEGHWAANELERDLRALVGAR
jgi:hypothetical protein